MRCSILKLVTICSEKQSLGDALVESVRDVMRLHNQQLAALAAGSHGLDRFSLAIQRARTKRARAKELYEIHACAHGC